MRERGEVSIPQAAKLLGVCERTLRRWVDELEAGDTRHCHFTVRIDFVGRRWLRRDEIVSTRQGRAHQG